MSLVRNLALAAIVLVSAVALADEKPVKESDVPKPALEAVKKKYPKATAKHFAREEEKGKVVYEVTIDDEGKKIDVTLSPEGKILEEEETIPADALPAEVKSGLDASKYKGWTIKKAERIVLEEKDTEPQYEVKVVQSGGEGRAEVKLDKSGKILESEDDEDDDD